MKNTLPINPGKMLLIPAMLLFAITFALANNYKKATARFKHEKEAMMGPLPGISYIGPNVYTKGVTIPPLVPTSSSVDAPGYNSPTVIGAAGLAFGQGLAVDAAGNIFVAQRYAGYIVELPAGGGPPKQLGTGFLPWAVAVDKDDNVYVVDYFHGAIYEILALDGSTQLIATDSSAPNGIGVDAQENIYVSDAGDNGGYVKEFLQGTHSAINLGSGINSSSAIAVDAAGDVFVSDIRNAPNNFIKKIPTGNGPVQTLVNNIYPEAMTIDPSGNLAVFGGNTPNIAVYNSSTGAFLNTIGPTFINVGGFGFDAAGNLYVGDANHVELKKIAAGTGAVSILNFGYTSPVGTAVDAAGNIYVVDATTATVSRLPAGGGTPVILASDPTFSLPECIALDAANNIYMGDAGNGNVYKIAAGTNTVSIIGSTIPNVLSLALDAAGNVYACNGTASIFKITPGSSHSVVVKTLHGVRSIALDALANMYAYDSYSVSDGHDGGTFYQNIYKLPNITGTPVAIGGAIPNVQPRCISADAQGDVFVGIGGNGTESSGIYEIPASNNTETNLIAPASNPPTAFNIDGKGNIYYCDGTAVYEMNPSGGYFLNGALPAGLSLDNTTGTISGTPTKAAPATNYTVTAYNSSGSTTASVNITVTTPNPYLKSIALSTGSVLVPVAGTSDFNYTATVDESTTSLTVTPIVQVASTVVTMGPNTIASGSPSLPITLNAFGTPTVINLVSTAADGATKRTYSISVTRTGSSNATMKSIVPSTATTLVLLGAGPASVNYSTSVDFNATTTALTCIPVDLNASVSVSANGILYPAATGPIPLNAAGATLITMTVTAADNVTTKTYSLSVTKTGSSNAHRGTIALNPTSTLVTVPGTSNLQYTTSVSPATSSVTVTATTADPFATIKIDGTTVAAGTASGPIVLMPVGTVTTIDILITAQDGVTTNLYKVMVSRTGSSNAGLKTITLNPAAPLTMVATGPGNYNYTATEPAGTTSVTLTETPVDAGTTVFIGASMLTNGAASAPIAVGAVPTTINLLSKAGDGVTTKKYVITVTVTPGMALYIPNMFGGLQQPAAADGIVVHHGVSPNGDGIDDVFKIDGLLAYPDNKVTIINSNGLVVYQAKGYNNVSKAFDGHSASGKMQQPGTYFFTLDYSANGETKHTSGYLVLKY